MSSRLFALLFVAGCIHVFRIGETSWRLPIEPLKEIGNWDIQPVCDFYQDIERNIVSSVFKSIDVGSINANHFGKKRLAHVSARSNRLDVLAYLPTYKCGAIVSIHAANVNNRPKILMDYNPHPSSLLYIDLWNIIHNKGQQMPSQVKSRQRVVEHGEVFTNEREVNAMLDLVKQETDRIDSRFLEPACGNGNFIAEVLRRKLAVVSARYKKSPLEYMRYAFVAASSIYGVDIMADNVEECRERLFSIVCDAARADIKGAVDPQFLDAVRYVIKKNILCADALTLKDADGKPISFAEWSMVTGDLVKRRDYLLSDLLDGNLNKGEMLSLFGAAGNAVQWEFDEETQSFIPSAVREYPPVDYREVSLNG